MRTNGKPGKRGELEREAGGWGEGEVGEKGEKRSKREELERNGGQGRGAEG